MPVINKPFYWSYSMLNAFETCPLQLKETRLTKRFSDRNKFNAAGTNDHSAMEHRTRDGQPLPPHMRKFEKIAGRILQIPGKQTSELELAVTKNWEPTGWFSKNAWCRAKVDFSVTSPDATSVSMFDWKFGKYRSANRWDQLKINSLLMQVHTDGPTSTYNNALVWLGQKPGIEKLVLTADHLPAIKEQIMEKVAPLNRAWLEDDFPAKQNGLCKKHCPVLSCVYNGRAAA